LLNLQTLHSMGKTAHVSAVPWIHD